MDLWIRSQDKELLLKPICFEIDEENKNTFLILIKTARNYNDICIGLYKTKERALGVLDEIQNLLQPKYILDSSSIKPDGDSWVENGVILQNYNANAKIEELSTYVYEMPKE